MMESKYKSYDDLPLFLNAAMVANVLGVSPSSGYADARTRLPGAEGRQQDGGTKRKVPGMGSTAHSGRWRSMRRYTKPIGWPRRDPRHYRFPIPNVVWEYKLRPVEFVIFSYLCYHQSTNLITPDVIAKGVHMAVGTVQKYLTGLVNKGLVSKDGTPALKCEAGNFFTLPNEVFLLNLLPSAFLVYAYLLLVENRRTHTCHPSYNTIAATTGLSKNTSLKSVGVLLEKGLITVESTSYFDQRGMKWKGNNLYTILPIRIAAEQFHQRQLRQLEMDAERGRLRPRAALCASTSAQATPDPSSTT